MNTSILTVVLTSALLAGRNETPAWQNDYSAAQEQGVIQKKPLVVVFASGTNNWEKIVRGTDPNPDLLNLLADQYVCVFIDTSEVPGKKLAQDFGFIAKTGFVISDRTGKSQAFWHQGDMTNSNMVHYLQKYSTPNVVLRGTETAPRVGNTVRVSNYPPTASEGVRTSYASRPTANC